MLLILIVLGGLTVFLGTGVAAQDINPTPFFTAFRSETGISSTFNGPPIPPGSIIRAYDQSGVLCGIDTVTTAGEFGYFSVYGDDTNTPEDEGAVSGEEIKFTINGKDAAVSGDHTWQHQTFKAISLSATSTIAISAVRLPSTRVVKFGDTAHIRVDVRNDGDGLDFYDVSVSLSVPGGPGDFQWEAIEPDSVIYADPGEVVSVYFDIRVPIFNDSLVNHVSYSVFSGLDPSVSVDGTVDVILALTDVEDGDGSLPRGFALEQNYPNPFNPTTTISFTLPVRSEARLVVYDMLGRTIDDRNLGVLADGPHEIEYDGSGLASGVYLYRLVTEYSSMSKKMVLLK
jgi:hypothetical protein